MKTEARTLLSIVTLIIGHCTAQAQFECTLPEQSEPVTEGAGRALTCDGNNPNSNSAGDYDLIYSRQDFWMPDATTPVITIPLAIHIFQDNLGQGTFTDVPATYTTLQQVVDWVNGIWSGGYAPSDPEVWHTTNMDPRIHFELANRIFFYPGTGFQTTCNLSQKMAYVAANYPDRAKYLGVYSTLPGTCGQYA